MTQFATAHFHLPRLHYLPLFILVARIRVQQVCRNWRPDLIVPLDEFSGTLLRGLATNQSVSDELRQLLEFSLGPASGYDAASNRTSLLELATKIGIRVPASRAVDRSTALRAATAICTKVGDGMKG